MTTTSPSDLQRFGDLQYDEPRNNYSSLPVYGPFKRLQLSDWGQSEINSDIVKVLDIMNINQMTPIQQHSFLYLMNRYNTAMIGFSKGKSIAYLCSIFSLFMNGCYDDKVKKGAIGPKAVILSSSLGSCNVLDNLSNIFNRASSKTKQIKVVVAYSHIQMKKIIGNLINGCDILICTPSSLVNIMNKTRLFHWNNLKHFVFDNIDLLLRNYDDEMSYFLNCLLKFEEHRDIQFISASVTWSKDIEDFLNQLFVKWQYIFGSHIEAARYMKIGLQLVYVKNDKLKELLEFLKNNIKYRRCILVASDTNELNTIYNYIKQNSHNIEVLLPGPMKCSVVYTLQKWHQSLAKNQLLFICSDEMMFDFYIDSADCLIHYDIPANKGTFSLRFSVLQDLNNVYIEKERNIYIFLCANSKDMNQLPKVVDLLKIFNGVVDTVLLKHSKIISEFLEKQKINSNLCSDIIKFGVCYNTSNCKDRHILSKELDKPAVNIPNSGLAIVKIINVYDASHMSAKLLKVNSTNNLMDEENWSNLEDKSDIINLKLQSFFSNNNCRILYEKPSLGDIVAVEFETKIESQITTIYLRAIVFDLITLNTMVPKVIVKLIDQGRIEIVSSYRVFVLPDMLKSIETNTVDIILASVKPIDNDKTWPIQANMAVKKQLDLVEDSGGTIIIKTKLVLGNTIWAKTLYKKTWHSEYNSYTTEQILPALLFNIGNADRNVYHIENITKLSSSAGIHKPKLQNNVQGITKNLKFSLNDYMSLYKLPQPQWAHLDDGCNWVSVEYVCNPKQLFLRNLKYVDRFNNIQIKIQNYVQQELVQQLDSSHIVDGALCLAKYPKSDLYYRVQIIVILDKLVEVLYVDVGELYIIEANSLLTIHPNLVVQLPFQAIECSLSGIKDTSLTSNNIDDQIDYLFSLTQTEKSLKIVNINGKASYTGGNHYEVVLYDEHSVTNLDMQSKFSEHCDDTEMSKLLDIINDTDSYHTQNDNFESHSINIKNILNEEKTSWLSCMALFNEIGVLEQYNLKLENNTVLAITEVQANDLKEEEIASTTPVETKNKNINSRTTVDVIEETKPVDSVLLEKTSKPRVHKLKTFKTPKAICLTCNCPELQTLVPVCFWYQDYENIYLKFKVLDIKNVHVNYEGDFFTFKARCEDAFYEFSVELFGLIDENNIVVKKNHDGLNIKAEKKYKTDIKWPRLFKCIKWHKYLMHDVDHLIYDEIKPQKIKDFSKYKFLSTGYYIMSDPTSDSESDNDMKVILED